MTTPLIEQVFGCQNNKAGQDLYGLELEIEDQEHILEEGLNIRGWTAVSDGSLRNCGLEFITSPPLKVGKIKTALLKLFERVSLEGEPYSDRTSIHVHCNMQGCTVDQLKSFCFLYLVTEKLFFDFVSKDRFENIFCVPLMDFAAPFQLFQGLQGNRIGTYWNKYTALNLLPLQELGTVEFRHMHGHSNIDAIVTWVEAIDCLKQACKKKSFDDWKSQVLALNTTSEYGVFLLELFSSVEASFLPTQSFDYYKEVLYPNILRAKMWEYYEKSAPKPTKREPVVEIPPEQTRAGAGRRVVLGGDGAPIAPMSEEQYIAAMAALRRTGLAPLPRGRW